jgi:ADP-ribose pyrophosphatase YjhB (NUDIX family)
VSRWPTPGSGDGFVTCAAGHRHWGRHGAAGLLLHHGGNVLLQHRATWSHEGGTWALPGGAVHRDEHPLSGALREAAEEAAVDAAAVRPLAAWTDDHGRWSYTTIVAEAVAPVAARAADAESLAVRWVPTAAVSGYPLHPGFAAAWPVLATLVGRDEHLVVDAANVIGSRPDGWWRDRAGATTRLLEGLATAAQEGFVATSGLTAPGPPGTSRTWPRVSAVLEGAGRGAIGSRSPDGAAEGSMTVVRAAGSGDDALVAHVAALPPTAAVTVVTADRALRERVTARARVVGPQRLLDALPR